MQGDARAPSGNLGWDVSADIEALSWDPFNPTRFLASSEDGIVAAFDARSGGGAAPLFRLSAHDKPACCLSFNPAARSLLATASTDKQVASSLILDKVTLTRPQIPIGLLCEAGLCACLFPGAPKALLSLCSAGRERNQRVQCSTCRSSCGMWPGRRH